MSLRVTAVADGSRPAAEYERLLTSLPDAETAWIDGTLADAPASGFVVFVSVRGAHGAPAELLPRLIVCAGGQRDAVEGLDAIPAAAAIDTVSLLEWEPSQAYAVGPAGRRSVGEAIGASCVSLFGGERNCLLQSSLHAGLPHLLANYLRAYERLVLGAPAA